MVAKFRLQFNDMGQGDCCFIQCPDKKVVVVDCGSAADFDFEKQYQTIGSLRSNNFIGANGGVVDALILTHPDRDHYNQVAKVFCQSDWKNDGKAKTLTVTSALGSYVYADSSGLVPDCKFAQVSKINTVLISSALTQTSPLGSYSQNGTNYALTVSPLDVGKVQEITINDTDSECLTWTKGGFKQKPVRSDIVGKCFVVASGNTGGKPWSVSIIAGNVFNSGTAEFGDFEIPDPAEAGNTRSLITLLQVGNKKALLMGDGTFSTEAFLFSQHGKTIQNCDWVLLGHHGSSTTSSSSFFAEKVKAKNGMVSVGFMEHSFCLPRETALDVWFNNMAKTQPEHVIEYWETKKLSFEQLDNLYNTWKTDKSYTSRYDVENNSERTFFYLEPKKGQTGETGIQVAFKNTGMTFYAEATKYPLYMTSMETQTVTLSA